MPESPAVVRTYVSHKMILYFSYILSLVAVGLASVIVEPLLLIAGITGLIVLFFAWRNHFFGFVMYITIYFLRPGERLGGLEALRLELVIGLFLLVVMLVSDAVKSSSIRFARDRVSYSLYFFIGVMALSVVFSEWISQSIDGFIVFIKIYIFYYFITNLVDSHQRFFWVIWLVVLFTNVIGIEAFINYLMGNFQHDQGIDRAEGLTSFGQNFNSLAIYMSTSIALLFYLAHRYRSYLVRLLFLILAGGNLATLVVTGSRSGLICLAATGLALVWFSRRRLVGLIAIAFIAIIGWMVMPSQYQERYSTIETSIIEGEIDSSSQGRLDAWKAGINMLIEKPLLGVGPKMFTDAYGRRKGIYLSSHSMYIEVLATMGILGTFAWGLFLWRFIQRLRQIRRTALETEETHFFADRFIVTTYAIIFGLLVAGVFGHILFRDTWYILAALTVALGTLIDPVETS